MSTTDPENSELNEEARRHLWMHFTRLGSTPTTRCP